MSEENLMVINFEIYDVVLVNQVIQECKEIYENSLIDGRPPKAGFVFPRVKCLTQAKGGLWRKLTWSMIPFTCLCSLFCFLIFFNLCINHMLCCQFTSFVKFTFINHYFMIYFQYIFIYHSQFHSAKKRKKKKEK